MSSPPAPPRQLRIVVEYDGTELCGWQRQDNGPTVQGHLEKALATLLSHPVRVTGASRTDAGVHAQGQVAAFTTRHTIPPDGIRRAVNSLLPSSVSVAEVTEVAAEFHPRHMATGKHYRYLLWNRPERSPLWHRTSWHVPGQLHDEAMSTASTALTGQHDYSAFRAVGCVSKSTIRRIERISVTRATHEPHLVAIDVEGNAFLRNMVRILAGTLVEVGRGRIDAAQMAEIIASRDRSRSGPTAPAHGLSLVRVRYDGTRPHSFAKVSV